VHNALKRLLSWDLSRLNCLYSKIWEHISKLIRSQWKPIKS